ncbi:N-acetylmuramate/N-acetylglucosamine kinase AmgK [Caulobacter sp. 17J80-11]|uniref:N-acetylmuramate/N-acetylglucosamine kinase AmgK n=1 Tax=Caulobacter sp. 17J80-11 TaxID=2763502 RepID=UPI0016539F6E|nr:phosphotransferase [Caulobacter sp. 17J80-11]MBC6981609.1 phosphotransferase [Caulobacter sp. 17J80-11]
MSSDREAVKSAFLAQAGLADAQRHPLPGDASTRRYERLQLASGTSLMLMDAPPSAESQPCPPDATPEERKAAGYNAMARLAAGRVDAFAACAGFLRSRGLSAPEIVALNAGEGLAVTEDLGDGLFARLIETGTDEKPLYFAAVEALASLHAEAPPAVLGADGARWPLLAYDDLALKTGGDLFVEWFGKFDPRVDLSDDARAEWEGLWAPIRARADAGASVFTHRDYHAENLLWLSGRQGAARVGMIDFQDAVRAHPSWDLHSLLQDARRDVSPELEAASLDRYFAARGGGVDREAFMADYAGLAALNEARILGIFARLVVRDGKPRYKAFMPRMWRHLNANLTKPGMEGLAAWFERHVPSEVRA